MGTTLGLPKGRWRRLSVRCQCQSLFVCLHRDADTLVIPAVEGTEVTGGAIYEGGIVYRGVAADQGPPGLGARIWRRTVQRVAVKEQDRAGSHLAIDEFEPILENLHAFWVRARLVTSLAMIETSEPVRPSEDLQTAIGPGGTIHGDHTTAHLLPQESAIPITVILMPLPCTAGVWLLHHHLMVVVIDIAAQQLLQRLDDTLVSSIGSIRVFPLEVVS